MNSRPKSYLREFSLKISELITYCEEENITPRNAITQTKFFVPDFSKSTIPKSNLKDKLQNVKEKR